MAKTFNQFINEAITHSDKKNMRSTGRKTGTYKHKDDYYIDDWGNKNRRLPARKTEPWSGTASGIKENRDSIRQRKLYNIAEANKKEPIIKFDLLLKIKGDPATEAKTFAHQYNLKTKLLSDDNKLFKKRYGKFSIMVVEGRFKDIIRLMRTLLRTKRMGGIITTRDTRAFNQMIIRLMRMMQQTKALEGENLKENNYSKEGELVHWLHAQRDLNRKITPATLERKVKSFFKYHNNPDKAQIKRLMDVGKRYLTESDEVHSMRY